MRKLLYWSAGTIVLLIILWWITLKIITLNDPLNKADAFVYSDDDIVHWFELTTKHGGKIEGSQNQQKYITVGETPVIEGKEYPLTGEKTDKGYTFIVDQHGNMTEFEAWFSGPHLSVQKQGEKEIKLYNPVNKEELDGYIKANQDYYSEEQEKNKAHEFFTELREIYGFLYSSKNGTLQLFIKIDEALLEGELSGSLLMREKTGKTVKETTYELSGITDGLMVNIFINVDGKTNKLEGNFHSPTEFDLSFWTSEQELSFHAITEENFLQMYEEFKNK